MNNYSEIKGVWPICVVLNYLIDAVLAINILSEPGPRTVSSQDPQNCQGNENGRFEHLKTRSKIKMSFRFQIL